MLQPLNQGIRISDPGVADAMLSHLNYGATGREELVSSQFVLDMYSLILLDLFDGHPLTQHASLLDIGSSFSVGLVRAKLVEAGRAFS